MPNKAILYMELLMSSTNTDTPLSKLLLSSWQFEFARTFPSLATSIPLKFVNG